MGLLFGICFIVWNLLWLGTICLFIKFRHCR